MGKPGPMPGRVWPVALSHASFRVFCFLLIASSDAEHDHGHGMKIELEAQ